jgi:hypothetical protein
MDGVTTYLGGETVAGAALKATTLWDTPNTGASHSSGFKALRGGWLHPTVSFTNMVLMAISIHLQLQITLQHGLAG